MLAATQSRVLALFEAGEPATRDLIRAIEGDLALTISVMRLANMGEGGARGNVDTVVQALEVLSPGAVLAVAQRARTYDFFERTAVWQNNPERFRLHGAATQRAVERIALEVDHEARDRLMVTAMMHDLGKLVLVHAYPGYPTQIHGDARTPEDRVQRERRELGVDHALVGGVVTRRWRLPTAITRVIESHHSGEADGEAAIIRLGDMLAHYLLGESVTPAEMLAAARAVNIDGDRLR
ncbi:MAG: HDOD domain-containing protein, partial [Acidobacteriota bacterium]|nr:HDOD domain-containing protein [Acidobacteriota bacterium]